MRTKVTRASPEVMLSRVLDGLAAELLKATDEEIVASAKELRMDLSMADSVAYAGVTYFSRPQLSDFFALKLKDPP